MKICFGTFDVEFAQRAVRSGAAVAFGLLREEALKGLTINSAEILGAGDQLSSIEKDKLADLILTDGDPLPVRTNIKQMFIAGRDVSLESLHTRDYEKWMKRPRLWGGGLQPVSSFGWIAASRHYWAEHDKVFNTQLSSL